MKLKDYLEKDPVGKMHKLEIDKAIAEGKSLREIALMISLLTRHQINPSKRTVSSYIRSLPKEIKEERKRNLPRKSNLPIFKEEQKDILSEEEEKQIEVYDRCPHCLKPLKWKEGNEIKVVLCQKRMFNDEKIREVCPQCRLPLDIFGYDPERLTSRRNDEKLRGLLR